MGSDMDCSETEEFLIAETNDFVSRRKVSRRRQVYSLDKRTGFIFPESFQYNERSSAWNGFVIIYTTYHR
jgi:hypothetical protein